MNRIARLADSYRTRLIIGYVLVASVFSAAWLWSLYGPLTDAVLTEQQANLRAVAHSAALVLEQPDKDPSEVAREIADVAGIRVTIVAADGAVMADSHFEAAGMENHGDRPEVSAALAGRTGAARRYSETGRLDSLYVAVPADLGSESVALRVSQPLAEIEAVAAASRRFGLMLLVLAVASASAMALWAARAAVRPIDELSRSAGRMAAGDLHAAVPAVPVDLQPMADSLVSLRNEIRGRIDALVAEKSILGATLNGLTDAVLVVEQDTIALTNIAARTMFKMPFREWRGADLESAGLPGSLVRAITEGLDDGRTDSLTLDPDPTGRVLRVSISPLRDDPRERAVVVVADVTERAALDMMRRDFVANASHELKTPTSGIRLLAQAVEAASTDGDIEQALAFARQIESETERLQHLVSDLLDLSRLEAAPTPDAVTDVRQAIERATLAHRGAADRKGLVLASDMSQVRGLDVFVAADATDVAIALDNLLDNAITYTATGSVTVSLATTDDAVEVRVSDTGIGIGPEHLSRVFERFYRVDRGRSREIGGTGLGLSLVRHVMERSGGSVSVTSELGADTTFTLTFPRAS